MPHYKDGTEAKIGDLVKGTGYNVKHEIIGKVVNVRPGESCTLSVAYVGAASRVYYCWDGLKNPDPSVPFCECRAEPCIEFGDTKCFEKIG